MGLTYFPGKEIEAITQFLLSKMILAVLTNSSPEVMFTYIEKYGSTTSNTALALI